MKILLDTCAVIWSAAQPEFLSPVAAEALVASGNCVNVSPVSCAELCCLQERGRIDIQGHWKTWFNRCVNDNGWFVRDVDLSVVEEAYSLPEEFHRDPVDRILVGTARIFGMTLVTADRRLLDYPHVNTLW